MAQQTNIGFDLTQLDSIIKRLDKSLDNLLVKSNNAANNLSSQIKSLTKTDLKQLGDELVALRGKVLGAKKTKGIRSEQPIVTDKICGFRKFDKVKYLGREYFIKGRMSTGYAVLMDIDGNKIDFSTMPRGYKTPKLSNCKRITARSTVMTQVKVV